MLTVYTAYRIRPDALAPLREALPAEARTVGLVSADNLETSLWRPFGAKKCIYVLSDDSRQFLAAEGIEFIAVEPHAFESEMRRPMKKWLRELDAEVVKTVRVLSRASQGEVEWSIVRLRAGTPLSSFDPASTRH